MINWSNLVQFALAVVYCARQEVVGRFVYLIIIIIIIIIWLVLAVYTCDFSLLLFNESVYVYLIVLSELPVCVLNR